MEKPRKGRGGRRKKGNSRKKPKLSSEITMDLFIEKAVLTGKIQPWQRKEIAVFFRDKKLKEKEDPEIYSATLAKY